MGARKKSRFWEAGIRVLFSEAGGGAKIAKIKSSKMEKTAKTAKNDLLSLKGCVLFALYGDSPGLGLFGCVFLFFSRPTSIACSCLS